MSSARRVLAACAAVVVLGLVLLTGHARRLGARLDATSVEVGGDADTVPDPSNAEPFAPSRFAVVGPVRGDHGALDRVFDALAEVGGVDVVLLVGDLAHATNDGALRALRASWNDTDAAVLALPGRGDRTPGRGDGAAAQLGPARFVFVRNDVRFVGVPGDDVDDRRFLAERVTPDAALVHTVHVRLDGAPGGDVLATADDLDARGRAAGGLAYAVGDVTRAGIALTYGVVPRGATLTAYRRDLALGVLYPVFAESASFAVLLVLATLALGGSWWIACVPRTPFVRS